MKHKQGVAGWLSSTRIVLTGGKHNCRIVLDDQCDEIPTDLQTIVRVALIFVGMLMIVVAVLVSIG